MKIISITPFVIKSNSKPPLWNGIATNLVKRCDIHYIKCNLFTENLPKFFLLVLRPTFSSISVMGIVRTKIIKNVGW